MSIGIYSSMSGAKNRALELEILANNIANVQTVGFKEIGVAFNAQLDKEVSDTNSEVPNVNFKSREMMNFTDGSSYKTDNPFDIAIQGDGFFEVQTPNGIRYTRNGHFTVNNEGNLITQNGDTIQSEEGLIKIPADGSVSISSSGEITVGDEKLGRLKIVSFDDRKQLKLEGNNLYSAEGLTKKETSSFQLSQGHLESSNVNLIRNLTRIVEVSRSYETCQKSMSQQFEITQQLNQIARI